MNTLAILLLIASAAAAPFQRLPEIEIPVHSAQYAVRCAGQPLRLQLADEMKLLKKWTAVPGDLDALIQRLPQDLREPLKLDAQKINTEILLHDEDLNEVQSDVTALVISGDCEMLPFFMENVPVTGEDTGRRILVKRDLWRQLSTTDQAAAVLNHALRRFYRRQLMAARDRYLYIGSVHGSARVNYIAVNDLQRESIWAKAWMSSVLADQAMPYVPPSPKTAPCYGQRDSSAVCNAGFDPVTDFREPVAPRYR